jgi:hypothetical protein
MEKATTSNLWSSFWDSKEISGDLVFFKEEMSSREGKKARSQTT